MGDSEADLDVSAKSLRISTKDSMLAGEQSYREFGKELEDFKDMQKIEVSRLQLQVETLTKKKLHFQEQFKTCRNETNKYRDDLTKAKHQLEELKARDGVVNKSNENIIERLRKEKAILENECKALKDLHKLLTQHPGSEAHRDELARAKEELKNMQDKYESLEQENEELRVQVSALSVALHEAKSPDKEDAKVKPVEEISDVKKELQGTHNRVKELESCISDGVNERTELSQKLAQSERQVAKLKASLRWMEKENARLEKRHEDDRLSIWDLSAQEEYKRKEKQELDSDLKYKSARVSSLEKEISSLKQQNADLKNKMERFKRSDDEKKSAIAELESVNVNAKENRQNLEEELVKARETLGKLNKEFKELQEDLFHTQKLLSDFQLDNKLLSDSKKKIEEELMEKIQKDSERQASLRALENDTSKKDYEIAKLKEKLRRMKAEFEEANRSCSTLSLQVNEYDKNVARSGEEMIEIQRKIDEYQTTCDVLRQEVDVKESTIERLSEKISYMESDMESLNTDLSYTKAMYNNNEEEVKRLTLKLKSYADENVRLSGLCHVAKKEKGALENQSSIAEEKVRSLEREAKKLRVRLEELEAKLLKDKNNSSPEWKRGSPREKSPRNSDFETSVAMGIAKNDSAREIHKLRQQLDDTTSELASLKKKLGEQITATESETRCRKEVEQKVLELEKELEELAKAKRNREDEFHKDRAMILDLEMHVKNLKKQNTLLQEQITEGSNKMVQSKEEVNKLQMSVLEQKKASEIVNEAVKLRDKTNEELRSNLKSLQKELVEAKDEVVQAKLVIDSKSEENDSLQHRTEVQREKIEGISKELLDMRESFQHLNAKLNSCNSKAHGFEMQLQASIREKDRYKSELSAALESIQRGKEELVATQSLVQEKERKVLSYRSELDDKETQIRNLLQELDLMEKENTKLKKDKVVAQFQNGVIKQNLVDTEDALRKAKLELTETEIAIAQLKNEKELTKEEQDQQFRDIETYREDEHRQRHEYRQLIESLNERISTAERDLKEAHQDNLKMNVENSKLVRKMDDFENLVGISEKEKKSLREHLIQATGKVSKLEVEYENAKRENETLRLQLKDLTKRADDTREEILKINQQLVEQTVLVDRKNSELSNKDAKIEHLRATNECNEKTLNEIKASMSNCKGENERLKIEQDSLRQEILAFQRNVSDAEMRYQVSLQENTKTREEFRISSNNVASSYEAKIAEMSEARKQVVGEVKQLKAERAQLNVEKDESKRNNEKLQEVLKNYQNELDGKDNAMKCLHDTKKDLTRELNELKDTLQDKDVEIQRCVEKISELEDNNNNDTNMLEERCSNLESEIYELKTEKDELEREIKSKDAKEKELIKKNEKLKENNAALEKQLEDIKQESLLAQGQLNESQSELNTTKDSFTIANSDLERTADELEIAQNQLEELKHQLEKSDAAKYQIEEELLKTKDNLLLKYDEILMLQREVQGLQYKWDGHEEELQQRHESIKNLNDENSATKKELQISQKETESMKNQIDSIAFQKLEIEKENFELKRSVADMERKVQAEILEKEKIKESVLHYQKRILQFKDEVQSYGRQYKGPLKKPSQTTESKQK